jgi:hypothetical protein
MAWSEAIREVQRLAAERAPRARRADVTDVPDPQALAARLRIDAGWLRRQSELVLRGSRSERQYANAAHTARAAADALDAAEAERAALIAAGDELVRGRAKWDVGRTAWESAAAAYRAPTPDPEATDG